MKSSSSSPRIRQTSDDVREPNGPATGRPMSTRSCDLTRLTDTPSHSSRLAAAITRNSTTHTNPLNLMLRKPHRTRRRARQVQVMFRRPRARRTGDVRAARLSIRHLRLPRRSASSSPTRRRPWSVEYDDILDDAVRELMQAEPFGTRRGRSRSLVVVVAFTTRSPRQHTLALSIDRSKSPPRRSNRTLLRDADRAGRVVGRALEMATDLVFGAVGPTMTWSE